MLQDLAIRNFRTFLHLDVSRLGRVNLFVGKNSVGKTTVLEGLRLFGSGWPPQIALQILSDRGELYGAGVSGPSYALQTIFSGRDAEHGTEARIGPLRPSDAPSELHITAEIESRTTTTATVPSPWDAMGPHKPFAPESLLSLKFVSGDRVFTLTATGGIGYHILSRNIKPPEVDFGPPFLRGTSSAASNQETAKRWDRIALTEGEQRVLSVLQMIAPIRGVSLVGDPRSGAGRQAKARVDGMSEPAPLAILGDGVVRMFQLAVAIEYAAIMGRGAADGKLPGNVFPMLLVDEIEIGIHYTLHADLWRFIFKAARDLGVQVFATTHSHDCLTGFARAVAESEENDGLVVRLEKVEGEEQTGAVIIDREDLPIVVREQIEVR